MKQETNDIIIKVITEWEQYQITTNFYANCDDMVRHMVNILKDLEFASCNIIDSLRSVADNLEEDAKHVLKNCEFNKEEDWNYGATDKKGADN